MYNTYMPQKVEFVGGMKKPPVLLSTHHLQQYDSKAEDVGFQRKVSIYCILWRHITTVFTTTDNTIIFSYNIQTLNYTMQLHTLSTY